MLYLLRAFGHEACGVADAITGLQTAQQSKFDAIICDILMPDVDGFHFIRVLRNDTDLSDVPVIAVTALAMQGDRERLFAAGFTGYIPKPIDPQTFAQHIEGLTRRRVAEPTANGRGPTILTVDDVPVNLDVIRGTLAPFGYRLIEAYSVYSAERELENIKPDLVLCDVHLPDGDGFELLAKMKSQARLREIPFIFLTSTAWPSGERQRGLALGARSFVVRPIDPQQLLAEVRMALNEGRRV